MKPMIDLRVYAVLDPSRCDGRDPVGLAAAAAAGGATLVQLRDKTSTTRDLVAMARAVRDVLDPPAVPLLINDRVDVALAADCAGVHVGQSDMAAADARRLLGPERIVGVTVHHLHEAEAVDPTIVDYVGIGPVFATASKDPGDPPMGPEGLGRLIAGLGDLPACGIAGIDHGNAAAVIGAGAAGVAVISDIFMAGDVEAATRRLRLVVDGALAKKASS
ncbi:MAG: thiamine phosphate synthase [Geminicoccaceae bacterium]|nr:thiamine phosphate synthase [Geminicoccaceae bacterium]